MLKILSALLIAAAVCISLSFADEQNANGTHNPKRPAHKTSAAAIPDPTGNLKKLTDPDPVVRRNAVIMLGMEKKKIYFMPISKMLDDTDVEVRRSAVNALAMSGDARAASVLMEKFKTEGNNNVKINIVTGLGELKSNAAVDMLVKLLKDSYPVFRNEALRALGKINAQETYPQIISMLNDEAEGVRVMAAQTAAQLGLKDAAPELQKNLANPVVVVRRSAADALGVVGDSTAVKQLEKLLTDADLSVSGAAKSAIEKIKQRTPVEKSAEEQPKKEPQKQPQ